MFAQLMLRGNFFFSGCLELSSFLKMAYSDIKMRFNVGHVSVNKMISGLWSTAYTVSSFILEKTL